MNQKQKNTHCISCIAIALAAIVLLMSFPALRTEAKTPSSSYNVELYDNNGNLYQQLTKGSGKAFSEQVITIIFGKSNCGNCDGMLAHAYQAYKNGCSVKIIYAMAFGDDEAYLNEKKAAYPGVEFISYSDANNESAWSIVEAEGLYRLSSSGYYTTTTPLTVIIPNDANRYPAYVHSGFDSDYRNTLQSLAGNTGRWVKHGSSNGGGTKWRYITAGGTYATGWTEIKGERYFFDADGNMVQNGWFQHGGNWYYLRPESGIMMRGWLKLGGNWYYFDLNGVMKSGWVQDGADYYYMRPSGVMATGWLQIGNTWYYLRPSGVMMRGWMKIGGAWYYFEDSGVMLANTSRNIDGKTYRFNASGVCTNP